MFFQYEGGSLEKALKRDERRMLAQMDARQYGL
jgi:hypothetical protein